MSRYNTCSMALVGLLAVVLLFPGEAIAQTYHEVTNPDAHLQGISLEHPTAAPGQLRAEARYGSVPSLTNCVPADMLFADDFANGAAQSWTTGGVGAWHVEDGNYIVDMGNIFENAGYSTAGDIGWTDYTYDVDLRGDKGVDKIILGRYQDRHHNYSVNVRAAFNGVSNLLLIRDVDAVLTTMATVPFVSNNNIWYHLSMVFEGRRIQVYVDDNLVVDVTDTSPQWISHGKIGLLGWNGAVVRYDNVRVCGQGNAVYYMPLLRRDQ